MSKKAKFLIGIAICFVILAGLSTVLYKGAEVPTEVVPAGNFNKFKAHPSG